VAGNEFRHLEHRYFALAPEDRLKLVVGHDVALVLGILKVVLLNVFPDLLNDFPS